jgi:drug/metabolite transporter (DMT)-like permease
MEDEKQEGVEMNDEQNKDIDQQRITKYKDIFDKHKNEEGFINSEDVNQIFNEFGRKSTIEDTDELIKKVTLDVDKKSIDFDNFVKLMESKDLEEIVGKEEIIPKKGLTNIQIYLFMLLLLITGSINTIANKLQQNTESLGIKYKGHQKFITFCMFNGEFLCLFFYWLKDGRKKSKTSEIIESELEPNINIKKKAKFWYFLFPALFDILGSSISSISLSFLPSSIYQMFRGAIIIFTCTASILFLKNKYYRHHFLGICIVVIGLIIVGVNAAIGGQDEFDSKIVLGIFLVVLSQVFSCLLFISEEKILKHYDVPPLKAVGMEGMWGVGCYIILLFIFYFIRCEDWYDILKDNICIKDGVGGDLRFENAIFAFKQIWDSWRIKLYLSMYVLSIAFFNFSGLTISKYASATSRTIVDTLRTILVWSFFLVMPFVPEDTKETFSWLQLLGFLVLILGGLIYNEILVLPFWGFATNTKAAIKKREEEEKLIEKGNQN